MADRAGLFTPTPNKMKKQKPDLKAYSIKRLPSDHESVRMGWFENIVFGKTEKEARLSALKELSDHGIEQNSWGDDFTYVSVTVIREPEYDKFLVDGKLKSRVQIQQDQDRIDRDNSFRQLLADNPNGWAYIRKGGYYYQSNHCGYTEYKSYAGIYSLQVAVKECLGMSLSDYMRPEPINVDEHNAMINKQIEGLTSRLINITDLPQIKD